MGRDIYNFEELPHLMIVESQDWPDEAAALTAGAIEILDRAEASYERFEVPRALEIPQAIQYAVRGLDFYTARRRFDAYLVFGCLIGDSSTVYKDVYRDISGVLIRLSVNHTLAIGNGLYFCDTKAAAERHVGEAQHTGHNAALAVLKMLALKSHFGIYPRT